MKNRFILIMLLIIFSISLCLLSCSGNSGGDKFLGTWKNKHNELIEISRAGEKDYNVKVILPPASTGFFAETHTSTASYQNDNLLVMGKVLLSYSQGKLISNGEEYENINSINTDQKITKQADTSAMIVKVKQEANTETNKQVNNDQSKKNPDGSLPFVGKKEMIEFWMVGFGGGFNILYAIEITKNKEVFLYRKTYYTIYDSTSAETKMYVGKYKPILKGIGEFSPNEYYSITSSTFKITDSQGNPLKLSGCCNQHAIAESGIQYKCECESSYY